jgi:papain like protease
MARLAAKRAPRRPESRQAERIRARARTAGPVRILNCMPSRETEKDWQVENVLAAGVLAAAPIPASKDLREFWWEINDQGSTGSCVGWATADSVMRWHFARIGRLGRKELLSPRFIWMASKETDEFRSQPTTFIESDGTSLKAALDIARRYGSVRSSVLPFDSCELYTGEVETFNAIAAQLKITSYVNLGRDLANWRRWIATKGPVLTRLDCDNTWMNAMETGGKLDLYDPMSRQGGHAVALVGYDPNMFIVRNSWGSDSWGDKGFGYASNIYAGAAFTEAYGVNVV